MDQLARYRVNPVVGCRNRNPLALAEAKSRIELRQGNRLNAFGNRQRLLGGDFNRCALAEVQNSLQPGRNGRISINQRCSHRRGFKEPQRVRQREVGNRGLTEQVVALLVLQLLLEPAHDHWPLQYRLFGGNAGGAATAEQCRAIGHERLEHVRGHFGKPYRGRLRLEHQAHRMLKHHRVSPRSKGTDHHFLTERKQGGDRFLLLQPARNQSRVAVDIRPHLQYRSLAIATAQRRQIGFWHHGRDMYRMPGQPFEAQ